MSIDGLITVYRRDTGEKVRIPPHWLDQPDLAEPFERTPSSRARAARDTTSPDTPATPGKASDLDTSTTATPTPSGSAGRNTTETPAAGAKE